LHHSRQIQKPAQTWVTSEGDTGRRRVTPDAPRAVVRLKRQDDSSLAARNTRWSKVGEPEDDLAEDKDCSNEDCRRSTDSCNREAGPHGNSLPVPQLLPQQPHPSDEEQGPNEGRNEKRVELQTGDSV